MAIQTCNSPVLARSNHQLVVSRLYKPACQYSMSPNRFWDSGHIKVGFSHHARRHQIRVYVQLALPRIGHQFPATSLFVSKDHSAFWFSSNPWQVSQHVNACLTAVGVRWKIRVARSPHLGFRDLIFRVLWSEGGRMYFDDRKDDKLGKVKDPIAKATKYVKTRSPREKLIMLVVAGILVSRSVNEFGLPLYHWL